MISYIFYRIKNYFYGTKTIDKKIFEKESVWISYRKKNNSNKSILNKWKITF